jgi:hypothetical protein
MAKTMKRDKHEGPALVQEAAGPVMRYDHARRLRKKLILQLQNKLTEFTVLHYNCDHSP